MMGTTWILLPITRLTVIALAASPAQNWQPQRPVRWMVPYVPGGATDLVTRTVAEPLGISMGQQFVVDNRPGATGTIAYDLVARAAADGHTITTAPDALTVLPPLDLFFWTGNHARHAGATRCRCA